MSLPAARPAQHVAPEDPGTTFTLLSIFIAFLLFGVLMTIRAMFSLGVDLAGLDRLMVIHKISITMPRRRRIRRSSRPCRAWMSSRKHMVWRVHQDPSNFATLPSNPSLLASTRGASPARADEGVGCRPAGRGLRCVSCEVFQV
jgi:hypothetical protein